MNRAAAVGFVLLLALASLPVLPAQTVSTPLVVESVTVADGRPMFVEGDPNTQTITVTVRNDGSRASTAYELRYEWMAPDGKRTYLRGSAQTSTDSGPAMLPGDDPHQHRALTWTPRASQVGPGHLVVSVVEGGARSEHAPIPLFVEDHGLTVAVRSMLPLEVAPDETLHIPIDARATGNLPEDVTWTVVQAHSRLTVTFAEPQQTVPHDDPDGATAVLVVHYPFQGSTDDLRDLVVEARATTPEGIVRTVLSPQIDILHGDAPPPAALSLDGPTATVFTTADETVQVPFTLTNTGSQPDQYTFTREATNGWEAAPATTPDGQTVEVLHLAAGASRDLLVPVTPGPDAQRLATLRLTATAGSGVADAATAGLALAGALPVLTSIGFTQDPLYQGDPAHLRVGYQNAGDAEMKDATLTVRVEYTDGGSATKTVALPDLLHGRSRTVTLDLGTARGAGQATILAELTAGTDRADQSAVAFVRTGLFTVTPPDPVVGHPGEQVRYHTPPHAFQVRNDGNAAETFHVRADGATLLGAASFALDPGQTRTVAVTQTVPADVDDARTVPVTLTAGLDAAPDRSVAATVATPVQDGAPPTVTWVEAPETMPPSSARPVRVHIDDDTYVHKAWIIVSPLDPDAPAGSALRVDLTESGEWIALLRSGTTGSFEMTPHAEDAFGNVGTGETRSLEVTEAPPPPAPEPVAIDEVRYENGTLTVRTNAPSVRVLVGGTETAYDVTDGELVLDLPLGAGSHLVQVLADAADGTTVAGNTTVDVAPPAKEPGLAARLTPGPGAALAALAVAVVAWRRNRGGPHD